MRTIVGLFESGDEARHAIDELGRLGLSRQKISVITNLSTKAAIEEGGDVGLHATRVSDIGTIAASGPLGSALESPKETAGLFATLQRMGFSPDLAEHYVSGVERGETLESVTVDDADADRVAAVMKRHTGVEPHAELRTEATGTGGAVIDRSLSSKVEPDEPEKK